MVIVNGPVVAFAEPRPSGPYSTQRVDLGGEAEVVTGETAHGLRGGGDVQVPPPHLEARPKG
jgi:hypothetical protein